MSKEKVVAVKALVSPRLTQEWTKGNPEGIELTLRAMLDQLNNYLRENHKAEHIFNTKGINLELYLIEPDEAIKDA